MLTHEPRQAESWLIFNVRQKVTFAFLLSLGEREERFFYGEDFSMAGVVCLLLALVLAIATWAGRKKKPGRFSYWLWVLAGSGVR